MQNRTIWIVFLALAVVLLSVSSCTHKPVHPDKSEQAWAYDHEACEKWVREGIRDEPDTYDNFDEMRLIRQCMKNKGWRWERTNLFDFKEENAK
jgi:hypothetical protein